MIKNSHILFDTCILNNLSSKESFLIDQTKLLLKKFSDLGNILYVSKFTKYELFRGANPNKKIACGELLKLFQVIPNSPERLERAIFPIEFRRPRGNLNCLYYYLLQANI